MKAHVLVRFGKWQEILDEPLPEDPDLYRATTTVWHYAKGIAHAALGRTAVAEAEQRRFEEAFARVPEARMFFNYRYVDILAVAAEMLRGEIAYRKDDHEAPFAHLRAAVARDDGLPYDEPWGWMQPTRHALGALLLEQGHARERRRSMRRIWEWIVATGGSRGTPTTSGACTAMSKPCIGLASTKRPTPFSLASIWRCRGPTSRFVRRAFAVSATSAARHDQRAVAGVARFSRETNACALSLPAREPKGASFTPLSASR